MNMNEIDMSKMKQVDKLADKCAKETIENIYRICDWALTGDEVSSLLGDNNNFNEAHSYLMRLVASKVAYELEKNNDR